MQNNTQNLQGQTGQPSPTTGSPQAPGSGNLQTPSDQQILDSQAQIRVPSSTSSTNLNQTSGAPESVMQSTGTPGIDMSGGLLVLIFLLGLSFILLLARLAIKSSDGQASEAPLPPTPPAVSQSPPPTALKPPKQQRKKSSRRKRQRATRRK